MHPRIQWVLPNASPVLLPERLEWPGQPFLPLRRPIEWDSPESCPYIVSCSKERLIVLLLRQTLPCHFSVYIIHLFSYAPAGYTHLSETVSQPAESPSEIFNFLMCVELYTCFSRWQQVFLYRFLSKRIFFMRFSSHSDQSSYSSYGLPVFR